MNVPLTVLSALLALQGCAIAPKHSSADVPMKNTLNAQFVPELNSLSAGDKVVFQNGELATLGQVTIGREYHAASGRQCKRILNATSQQLVTVACKAQNGRWYMRKVLNSVSARNEYDPTKIQDSDNELLVPTTKWESKELEKSPIVGDSYRLENNETLWSFSKRTTGNALNWRAIAKYNDVDNESELTAGTPIRIPAALHHVGP